MSQIVFQLFRPCCAFLLAASIALLPSLDIAAQIVAPGDAVKSPVKQTLPPPEIAFKAAMRPFELTRSAVSNWSDIEVAALGTTTRSAAAECAARKAADYSGEDLYFLARLCSLGQNWPATLSAASRYIADPGARNLALGYAFRIQALLQLQDAGNAVSAAKTMLEQLPYDATVSATTHDAIRALEIQYREQAIEVALAQEPHLLKAFTNPFSVSAPLAGEPDKATLKAGTLYAEGMHLAMLLKFAGQDVSAASVARRVRTAVAAIRSTLAPEDVLAMGNADTQYALVGARLPSLSIVKQYSTYSFREEYGAGAVLLFYPDWCMHCAAMTKDLVQFAARFGQRNIRAYGIVIQAAEKPSPEQSAQLDAKLAGTPSSLVALETQRMLGTDSFPLAVITDSKGVVRLVQASSETVFQPGGYLEDVMLTLAEESTLHEDAGAGRQPSQSSAVGVEAIATRE